MSEQIEPYQDRAYAGRVLAERLRESNRDSDLLILGLSNGGMPCAREVARILDAELDVLVVRKLEFPGSENLAMGAIASGGVTVRNPEFSPHNPRNSHRLKRAAHRKRKELALQEMAFRGTRPFPELKGRSVVLVDDGLETGSTMRAAIEFVSRKKPHRIVVAVPLGSEEAVQELEAIADEVICLAIPSSFDRVGSFYENFPPVSDDEIQGMLEQSWATRDGLDS